MPWPFRRSLSDPQRSGVLAILRHCQFLIATQQLTMEIYNDAMEQASDIFARGDDIFVRSMGSVANPERTKALVIPALEEKVEILEELGERHASIAPAGVAHLAIVQDAMEGMRRALDGWLARARLQLECLTEWIADPVTDVSDRIGALDNAETQATTAGLAAVNRLIPAAGLDANTFSEVNRAAFNVVRARRGMKPLSASEFKSRYARGMAGERVRLFTD